MQNEEKAVEIGAKMKAAFDLWLLERRQNAEIMPVLMAYEHFELLPFEMQQGVYTTFLREKDVYPEARPVIYHGLKDAEWFSPHIGGCTLNYKSLRQDHNTALAAAITAGFSHLENSMQTPGKPEEMK